MTTILGIADLHNQFHRFRPTAMPDADMVFVAGDITQIGRHDIMELAFAHNWMEQMAARYRWVYYVLGNHDAGLGTFAFDTPEGKRPPWCMGVDNRVIGHDKWQIVGSSLTPCFDRPKMQIQHRNVTGNRAKDAREWENLHSGAALIISHAPPVGVLDAAGHDDAGNERHIGSPGLRDYIERNQPKLVVCGHVHGAVGAERLGQTLVVNTARSATLITIGDNGEKDAEIVG